MKNGPSFFFGMNWALGTDPYEAYDIITIISYFECALNILAFFFLAILLSKVIRNKRTVRANANERRREWSQVHSKMDCFVLCKERWTHTQGANQYQKSNTQKSEQISLVDTIYGMRFWVCIALYVL